MCVLQALSTVRSISLELCYRQVENLAENLEGLKQRFGLSSTQRLVHFAHLVMEKVWSSARGPSRGPKLIRTRSDPSVSVICVFQLFDSAVYTLELFLQSSARLQPSHIPVKMERAKERVLKVRTGITWNFKWI